MLGYVPVIAYLHLSTQHLDTRCASTPCRHIQRYLVPQSQCQRVSCQGVTPDSRQSMWEEEMVLYTTSSLHYNTSKTDIADKADKLYFSSKKRSNSFLTLSAVAFLPNLAATSPHENF